MKKIIVAMCLLFTGCQEVAMENTPIDPTTTVYALYPAETTHPFVSEPWLANKMVTSKSIDIKYETVEKGFLFKKSVVRPNFVLYVVDNKPHSANWMDNNAITINTATGGVVRVNVNASYTVKKENSTHYLFTHQDNDQKKIMEAVKKDITTIVTDEYNGNSLLPLASVNSNLLKAMSDKYAGQGITIDFVKIVSVKSVEVSTAKSIPTAVLYRPSKITSKD